MTNSKTRGVRRLLIERLGIDDNQLAYEIVQYVMTPDAAAPNGKQGHPAVLCAKRITGRAVPPIMFEDVINKLGERPDEERAKSCYLSQARRGYTEAWWWLDDYAGTNQRPAAVSSSPTSVVEWRE